MAKITFLGAGSTIFVKNVLGDCLLSEALRDAHIALYDIDGTRLDETRRMMEVLNANINAGRARFSVHAGPAQRREALRDADYVVNAVQVGGYEPSTVIDFEVPKRHGLRQTIGDTLGIGGIFRALRTIPVMLDFARDMEKVCPDAWFLNYTNPMAMLTMAMLRGSSIRTVGLCHSVQGCATGLIDHLGLRERIRDLQWKIAGINHQAWLLEITDGGRDLYPLIKSRAQAVLRECRTPGAWKSHDLVRYHLMLNVGYYVTESSEHNAEYLPYYIKAGFPELIEAFNIPLDEYPRRCIAQMKRWKSQARELLNDPRLSHQRSHEYGASIMEAVETDVPCRIAGNVMNRGLITNLPALAAVEVPCLVDRNGVQPCAMGDLPETCAALNRTNINPQILAVEAAFARSRDLIYQAAMLDPHTAAELPIDNIRALCDDMIAAHGAMLPSYRVVRIKACPAPSAADHGAIVPFHLIGPFERTRERSRPDFPRAGTPEAGIDLKAALKGKGGRQVTWRRVVARELPPTGHVELDRFAGADLQSTAYAYAVLIARAACRVTLELGCDYGMSVWLNGARVFENDVVRVAARAQEAVDLKLAKGRNALLMRIDNKDGGWSFFANLRRKYPGVSVEAE